MGRTEWLLLIFLSLLWGSSFFFIELSLETITVFTVVLLRVAIAALICHLCIGSTVADDSLSMEAVSDPWSVTCQFAD